MNSKLILSILNIKNLTLLLLVFISPVNAETKIVAGSGDTLFKLSRKYGVSLKELMHKNNYNDASKIIEGEVIIIPIEKPTNNQSILNNGSLNYKVIEGDTIYKIARKYQVKPIHIISINNLDESSYLKPNQILILPKEAILKNFKIASKKVSFHQISKGEKLIDIARIHNVSIEKIKSLNKISYLTEFNSKSKLKVRETSADRDRWLKYGYLKINWSNWRYLDGNYITEAKNQKNRIFFLAINCKKRALNNTLNNDYWRNWYFPKIDFEYKFINDFCYQDYKL
tara:strand:+ start:4648 stop:5499 length:852 start_codon:yes stop_codon:yes gene_type:complete